MCGIAGIVGCLDERNRAALRRITSAMSHRGPDGEGFWESSPDESGFGVMFGHRRLAILDLSNAAAQPMTDPAFGHVLVLNGEIYNYVALRDRLQAEGHRFESSGDTAVMLRALCKDDVGAIAKLRGMFAFGFWNRDRRSLVLARDPLGIKPLYILRNPTPGARWSLAFASELRALLASGLIERPTLRPAAVGSVIWNGFVVAPNTAVEQIESLMPGEWRSFDGQGTETGRAEYALSSSPPERPIDEREIEQQLEESVRVHLISDVPLGIFLSGGVDSSAIANLAQRALKGSVNTFTLAFDEREYNEGAIARQVADAIGTRHQEVLLTEQGFVDKLEDALDSLDQPTFDGLNSFYMSHAVRQAGFKVALVGTGGDELFGGYASFRDLPHFARWRAWTRWLPGGLQAEVARMLASATQGQASGFPRQTRWAKLPDILAARGDLLAIYQLAYGLFLPQTQQRILQSGIADSLTDGLPERMLSRLRSEMSGRTALETIGLLERRLFLGERLLRDTDAASMSASIEIRLPLVDQVLAEAVDRLPERTRFCPVGRKALLRRVGLRGLNPQLFDRPKSGFVLPFDRWLKGKLGEVVHSTMLDHDAAQRVGLESGEIERLWKAYSIGAPGLYWSRIWALYVLMRWCQRHGVHLAAAAA